MFTILYSFIGELGESIDTPNALQIPSITTSTVKFKQFLEIIQSQKGILGAGQHHYRFRMDDAKHGYVWLDITNGEETIPAYSFNNSNNNIMVKILKLDQESSMKRKSRLRLKQNLDNGNSTKYVASAGSKNKSGSENSNSKKDYNTSYSDTISPRPDSNKSTTTAAASSKNSIVPPISQPSQSAPVVEDLFSFSHDEFQDFQSSPIVSTSDSKSSSSADFGVDIDIDESNGKPLSREELAAKRMNTVAEKVNEAMEFKREVDEKQKKESDEFDLAKTKHDKNLENWAHNNKEKRNIRTLLSTMHTVLWPGCSWQAVGLGDVLDAKQVKLKYRKAMLVVHPDRCSGSSAEVKFIAKRIFEAINEAYEEFLKKESV
jgi:hypothetical protein